VNFVGFLAHLIRLDCDLAAMLLIDLIVITTILWCFLRGVRTNAGALNRKAAGEIFEYLTTPIYFPSDPLEIATIFRRNARHFDHARHVASIVRTSLIDAGATRQAAMASHATIMAAAILLPV
jgi:hypothetical protein